MQTAEQIFERYYLEIRCGLLDLAAHFDRLDRAPVTGPFESDSRRQRIAQALEILADPVGNRAERLQILFSDPYVEGWQSKPEGKP